MTSIGFEKVYFGYGQNLIFRDLTIHLKGDPLSRSGHVIAIMGPSGTGKTTMLRLVSGIETPSRGSVEISPSNASVSYLQQDPVLFEHLSRYENARYFTLVKRTRPQFDETLFRRLLAKLKLAPVLDSAGGIEEMSGGERQRLSLLRALSIKPKVLLLDEPCTGLDVSVKLEFLHMLREVVDDLSLLALYVTHHAEEAQVIADELLYLSSAAPSTGLRATLMPMTQTFSCPPSIEAAQALMSPAANVISCSVENRGVYASGLYLGQIRDGELVPGRYTLVFSPANVKWKQSRQEGLEIVGASALYWFVKVTEASQLLGPRTSFQPNSYRLSGPVVAFREGDGGGIQTTIFDHDYSESEDSFPGNQVEV